MVTRDQRHPDLGAMQRLIPIGGGQGMPIDRIQRASVEPNLCRLGCRQGEDRLWNMCRAGEMGGCPHLFTCPLEASLAGDQKWVDIE